MRMFVCELIFTIPCDISCNGKVAIAACWAMAFPKWNPLISVCVVVPLGVWSGEIIYEMVPTNRRIFFTGNLVKQQNHIENIENIGSTTIEHKLKNGKRISGCYEFNLEKESNVAILDMIVAVNHLKMTFIYFIQLTQRR